MYLYLSFISILICLTSANNNDLNDQQPNLDDYSQAINNYDLASLNNSTSQNVLDLLQTIQEANSTAQFTTRNITDLNQTNLTSPNIPILFNSYQYDLANYQDARIKESSASSQLDSSDTNQNYYAAKEFSGFDDNQKMFIEQQIEQDSKYMPEVFDLPPPVPTQIIQQPMIDQISGSQYDYGTKINKITKPTIQNTIKNTPILVSNNRLNKYSTKGSNSIKMANNQEWNVMDKNQQSGYIHVNQNSLGNAIKSKSNNYQTSDDGFTSLDQQYDLSKANKIKFVNQPSYRPSDDVQIITSNNQILASQFNQQPIQQQIISSSSYPSVKQQQPQQSGYIRKLPCTKNQQQQQRPFYFGWKQRQPTNQLNQQRQKIAVNQALNFIQQQPQQTTYSNNYQANKHFGMPNQFDQQSAIGQQQFNNKIRKCCIVKFVPKPNYNRGSQFAASSMPLNPFQNNLTGMFGVGVNSVVHKIENKKSKIKNLIKAPFVFVNDMKHKALSSSNQFRPPSSSNFNSNYNSNYNPNYNPNYVQQQNTFTKSSYNQEY